MLTKWSISLKPSYTVLWLINNLYKDFTFSLILGNCFEDYDTSIFWKNCFLNYFKQITFSYTWVAIFENVKLIYMHCVAEIQSLRGRAKGNDIVKQLGGNHKTEKWNLSACVSAGQVSTVWGQTNSEKASSCLCVIFIYRGIILLKITQGCFGCICHNL